MMRRPIGREMARTAVVVGTADFTRMHGAGSTPLVVTACWRTDFKGDCHGKDG